jgi:hypothetical protein
MAFFQAVSEAIMARTSRELVGAMFIATALALVLSLVYKLARRKVADTSMVVVGVAIIANAAGMITALGYIQSRGPFFAYDGPSIPRQIRSDYAKTGHPINKAMRGSPEWFGPSAGFHMLFAADTNRDGRLTPEEVAEFVRTADTEKRGFAEMKELDEAVRRRMSEHPFRQTGYGPMSRRPETLWGPGVPEARWKRRAGKGTAPASADGTSPPPGPVSAASRNGTGV